ncbi:MAG: exopolysaccharide biosynthesis polyprenyl glycosylphosphotransferase [Patescibacteria group bacterium]
MVQLNNKFRIAGLLLGDVTALYAALFITLMLRYGETFYAEFLRSHFAPFTIIFAFWFVVFYVAGLYDLRHLRNNLDFFKTLGASLAVNFTIAVFFFYLIPSFVIAPKRNLFIFLLIFGLIEFFWRRFFNKLATSGEAPNRVLLIVPHAASPVQELVRTSLWLRQIGYEITAQIPEADIASAPEKLERIVAEKKINFIAVPRRLRSNNKLAKQLYEFLGKGVEVRDLSAFYESVTRKVPLEEVEESWFLENLVNIETSYDPAKRAAEFIAAAILGLILLPLGLVLAIFVKLSSPGPVIYKQTRIGKGGKEFTLYKFRTMKLHNNHVWPEENDERITRVGKFLRKTHLDEMPQLWNIVKGDISVVGPRPDFVDFYKNLERDIPYYAIRTIIKPGLTGWAQIHQPITASLEDTKERLAYDLYYIKNRSLILDMAIVLKTLKVLFTAKGL